MIAYLEFIFNVAPLSTRIPDGPVNINNIKELDDE